MLVFGHLASRSSVSVSSGSEEHGLRGGEERLTVIYSEGTFEHFGPVEVVHGEYGRTLVFVHEKGETARLAGLGIAGHVDVGDCCHQC
jgi:hypothetical protein